MIHTTTNLKTVQGKGLTMHQLEQIDLFLHVYHSLTANSVRTKYDVYTELYTVYLLVQTESGFRFEAPISSTFKTQLSASEKAHAVRNYIDARKGGQS